MADRRPARAALRSGADALERIDALDPRLVDLLNERATLASEAGRVKTAAGRRAIHDPERETRSCSGCPWPTSPRQADLVALYRRLFVATRALESRDGRMVELSLARPRPTDLTHDPTSVFAP